MMKNLIKLMAVLFLFASNIVLANYSEKEADAVFNKIEKEYKLNTDGSTEFHYSSEVKLLTGYSVNRAYGETFIIYNPDYQELKVNHAYTVMADGKEVASPANAFNEVLPRCAAHSAPNMNLREMVVTHTGLEKDAVIYLDYTIKTKSGFLPGFGDLFVIPENSPVKEYKISIIIPEGIKLNHGVLNYKIKPALKKSGGIDTYTYKFSHIPLNKHEAGSPKDIDLLPTFWFSTINKNEIRKHVYGQTDLFEINDEIIKKAAELTEAKTEILDKALALQSYVENNISLSHCPFKYSGYKPMTAQEVFDRNNGSVLDKSILLAAMCREAGIKASPLLATEIWDKELARSINSYSKAAVAVELVPDIMAIIAVNSHDQEFFIKNDGFIPLFEDDDFERMAFDTPAPGKLSFGLKLKMDENGKLSGTVNAFIKGEYLHDYKKSTAVKLFKSVIGNGYKTNFEDSGIIYPENPVYNCNLNIETSQEPEFFRNGCSIELPFSKGSIEKYFGELINAERSNPLKIMHRIDETIEYVIELPGNIEVYIPENKSITNAIGKCEIKYIKKGDKLFITKTIYFDQTEITPDEYLEFYPLISAWLTDSFNQLNLIRK